MRWLRTALLAIPFAIAAVLNALSLAADRLHLNREHIAASGFLFGTPWAWLLDQGWLPDRHYHWLQIIVGYSIILWIPAALYSACIWLLFAGFGKLKKNL